VGPIITAPEPTRSGPPANVYLVTLHDLDLMTLVLDLDLNVLKTNMRTKNEVCRSTHSKVRSQGSQTQFWSCDLDFHPMTLIHELDLNVLKMCLHARNEIFKFQS